LDPAETVNMSG